MGFYGLGLRATSLDGLKQFSRVSGLLKGFRVKRTEETTCEGLVGFGGFGSTGVLS